MRKRLTVALLAAVAAVAVYAGTVLATPQSGFTPTQIAKATIGDIDLKAHTKPADDWHFQLKTNGVSDMYVIRNSIAPGGSSGWHTHPGPSLITVTAGSVAVYDGDDPTCTPHVYTAGADAAFLDLGGDHVHLIRNETSQPAETVVVQFVPKDATRRIDAPPPGNCPF